MTVKFFSSWEVYTKGIRSLISAANLPDDEEVWCMDDGSYAVGDSTDLYDANPDIDLESYTYAGTVAEYRD